MFQVSVCHSKHLNAFVCIMNRFFRFLKGECVSKDCLLSHNVSLEKMPVCLFFLEGRCTKNDCPYLHKKVSENERICEDFLKGFCSLADKVLLVIWHRTRLGIRHFLFFILVSTTSWIYLSGDWPLWCVWTSKLSLSTQPSECYQKAAWDCSWKGKPYQIRTSWEGVPTRRPSFCTKILF